MKGCDANLTNLPHSPPLPILTIICASLNGTVEKRRPVNQYPKPHHGISISSIPEGCKAQSTSYRYNCSL
eukprot:scaffold78879_cov34-Cyclotella_meneghiniana.AAC.1